MKMRKTAALLSAALLLGSLAGCGASSGTAASASASASQPASSSAEAVQAKTVEPLAGPTVADPMNDGIYPASFTAADLDDTEGGYTLNVMLWAYDLYDMAEVSSLAVGDTVRTHGGDVTVESVDFGEDGLVTINGGVEEGGMYLTPEDTVYRTLTMDDYPEYYELGETLLPVSAEVALTDSSADVQAEPVVSEGEAAVAEALGADTAGFTCYNTTVRTENGAVAEITRVWVP